MKNTTSSIRQMRADVDRLAKSDTSHEIVERITILRDHANLIKIRMRRLHFGERIRNGDLWFEASTGTLHTIPWRWYRAFVGWVAADSVEHYRIAP
jgi:hypothetical protein